MTGELNRYPTITFYPPVLTAILANILSSAHGVILVVSAIQSWRREIGMVANRLLTLRIYTVTRPSYLTRQICRLVRDDTVSFVFLVLN